MFDHTSRSVGLAVLVAVMSAGCDAARPPAAPTTESAAADFVALSQTDAPTSGVFTVPIERGSLEISSRDDVALNVASKDPARFSWTGGLFDGGNPFGQNGAPGETVSIVGSWAGSSLTATTLTWGKTVFTQIGAWEGNTGGRFRVYGTVTLPLYTGQRIDKVRGTFTISRPGEEPGISFFAGAGLQLRLSGGGRTTVSVEWQTDCCWEITHLSYRFN